MFAILKYCENSIKHMVELPGKVAREKSQYEISVLLQQRVFMPVAAVGFLVT